MSFGQTDLKGRSGGGENDPDVKSMTDCLPSFTLGTGGFVAQYILRVTEKRGPKGEEEINATNGMGRGGEARHYEF